jgi:hypothetical protein
MKRRLFVAGIGVSAALLLLASVYAITNNKSSAGSSEAPPQAAAVPITPGFFAVPGMPVELSELVTNGDQTSPAIAYSIANKSSETLAEVHLMMLNFSPGGQIERVEGWIDRAELKPSAAGKREIRLKRRAAENARLFVTVAATVGTEGKWAVAAPDLVRAVATKVRDNTATPPQVQRLIGKGLEDSGSSFCLQAYQQAVNAPRAGDKLVITSFSCDQYRRSYNYSYNTTQ